MSRARNRRILGLLAIADGSSKAQASSSFDGVSSTGMRRKTVMHRQPQRPPQATETAQIDIEDAIAVKRSEICGASALADEGDMPPNDQDAHLRGESCDWFDRELYIRQACEPRALQLEEIAERGNVSWLWEGVLQDGEASGIYGNSGLGKSLFALWLAVCIGFGLPFFGRKTRESLVIYICAEGASGMDDRVRAVLSELGLQDEAPRIFFIPASIDLLKRKGAPNEELAGLRKNLHAIQCASRIPIGLVIVDTLARCYGDGDENNNRDVSAIIRGIDEEICRPTGAAALVIAHAGKDRSRGARGGMALKNGLSGLFCLDKHQDLDASVLTCEKQKEGPPTEPMIFAVKEVEIPDRRSSEMIKAPVIEPIEDETGHQVGPRLSPQQKIVYEALQALGGEATRVDLRAKAVKSGLPTKRRATFPEAVKRLTEIGLVQAVDDDRVKIIG